MQKVSTSHPFTQTSVTLKIWCKNKKKFYHDQLFILHICYLEKVTLPKIKMCEMTEKPRQFILYMCICMYVCMCVCVCVCIYIYIYRVFHDFRA